MLWDTSVLKKVGLKQLFALSLNMYLIHVFHL